MSVVVIEVVVSTTVLILLVLITAPAVLDTDYTLINANVQVSIYLSCKPEI